MTGDKATLFFTTRWTLVAEAAQMGDENAKEALGELCQSYWQPLYRFARRTGKAPEDAEDLVQGFFAYLLELDSLRQANPERGRFRAFLLGAFKHFMSNDWHRQHRKKRGGFAPHISLDWQDAESGLSMNIEDGRSPDRLFDREWALALLEKVLADLEREEPGFEKWKGFLSLEGHNLNYGEIASDFEMSEGAVRVAVHRLRKRYRQRVQDEIAGSLSDATMVEDEMKFLLAALVEDFQ